MSQEAEQLHTQNWKLHSSIMTASFSDLLMIHDFLINTTHSGVGEEQTVCGLKKQEAELLMFLLVMKLKTSCFHHLEQKGKFES